MLGPHCPDTDKTLVLGAWRLKKHTWRTQRVLHATALILPTPTERHKLRMALEPSAAATAAPADVLVDGVLLTAEARYASAVPECAPSLHLRPVMHKVLTAIASKLWTASSVAELDAATIGPMVEAWDRLSPELGWNTDHELCKLWCRATARLVADTGTVGLVAFRNAGGLNVLRSIMTACYDVEAVQVQGLQTLWTYLHVNNKVAADGDGCLLNAVFAAMEVFGTSSEVHWAACGILCLFSRNQHHRPGMMAQGAVTRLCAVLSCAPLQDAHPNACFALGNLALDPSNIASVARALPHVLATMDISISGHARAVAHCLERVSGSKEHDAVMMSCGVVSKLFAVMEAHPKCPIILLSVCITLRHLTFGTRCRSACAEIAASGGIAKICAVIDTPRTCIGVLVEACAILQSLTSELDSLGPFSEAGMIKTLYAMMDTHPNEVDIQQTACGTLGNLAVRSPLAGTIISTGGLVRVVMAVEDHPADETLQICVCWALHNFSVLPGTRQVMADSGGSAHLARLLPVHRAEVAKFVERVKHVEALKPRSSRFTKHDIITTHERNKPSVPTRNRCKM